MILDLLREAKEKILEKEREKGIKRIFAEEPNLYIEWKKKYAPSFAIRTLWKLYIPGEKKKILDSRLPSLVTDLEALRFLLEAELDRRKIKKLYYYTDFIDANRLYFPQIFKKGKFEGKFFKVDIKSCFYHIYSTIGIDTQIKADIDHENRSIHVLGTCAGSIWKKESEIIRLLEGEKLLRNAVYGLTRSCFELHYSHQGVRRAYFRGRLQNMDLLVVIASILHHIVSKTKDYILYWNIDGGIISEDGYTILKKETEDWGFQLRIEEIGEYVDIQAIGSYSIGNKSTKHYQKGVTTQMQEKIYIYAVKNINNIKKIFQRRLSL